MELTLSSGTASATVLADGAKVSTLKFGDHSVLLSEGPKVTRFGSFPMIPWCGRLAQAKLDWKNKVYEFEANSGAHANHGFGHTNVWEVVSSAQDSVTLSLDLTPFWELGGTASQTFTLTENELTVGCSLTGTDQSFPYMIGWHPWFVRELPNGEVATLDFAAEQMYELDSEQIPNGNLVSIPPGPWDNCFIGVNKDPVIRYGESLALTISSSVDHWVIFTEPPHAFCVEPQTGPPNQLNSSPKVLEPGETGSAWMKITSSTG